MSQARVDGGVARPELFRVRFAIHGFVVGTGMMRVCDKYVIIVGDSIHKNNELRDA
jgi:hypothetical protein